MCRKPSKPSYAFCLLLAWLLIAGSAAPAQTDDSPGFEDAPPLRLWTDASGKYQFEAAMIKCTGGKVHLKSKDGKLVIVPVDRLSKTDQRYVKRELARKAARRESPPAAKSESTSAPTVEWPGWRGPHRDGKSPDKGLLRQWPPEGPQLLWKVDNIGKGFSTVAVSGGTVYTTGDVGENLVIFAFDLDGKPRWKTVAGSSWTKSHPGSRSTPTIDEGRLYLVSGVGQVGCYDAKTGRPIWGREMRQFGGKTPGWGYAESVLILQNLAVVTPGGDNCIVALDKKTGRPVWSSRGFKAGAQYGSCYAFVWQGVPTITTGTSEGIVGVDARSGQMLWSNAFSARNTANCPTPVFSDGYVFWANGYGKGGICLKLTVQAGRVRAEEAWRTKEMVCHHGGYIIHKGYIYGNHSGGWACLELRTGRKMWSERAVGKGSVCFADGMLYLFGENGGKAGLATCSPEGLEMRGSFSVQGSGPSWAHPVVIGGRLYLRYDTNLYCYNVRVESDR